jgi:hypothetical protein
MNPFPVLNKLKCESKSSLKRQIKQIKKGTVIKVNNPIYPRTEVNLKFSPYILE